ncbi:MAG: hypothetical protein ACFFD2_29605 [Promethearchaeota archaeon]
MQKIISLFLGNFPEVSSFHSFFTKEYSNQLQISTATVPPTKYSKPPIYRGKNMKE